MTDAFTTRGFLPSRDPARAFPRGSRYALLDDLGRRLPEWVSNPNFRKDAERWSIPEWNDPITPKTLPLLRLYYVRIGFLASGYVNQIGEPPTNRLPASLARPLCRVCELLDRPPMLSYDGYALYNWYRIDRRGPIALGNIDTVQNFVSLYDEHWFILVHIEIEALAARSLAAILALEDSGWTDRRCVNNAIQTITQNVHAMTAVLRRIPERMSPALYFKEFRPYIRFFEDVHYEGVAHPAVSYRGETGAQSTVIPALVAFFKIPHEPSALTRHVADMRTYMPQSHRELLERFDRAPDPRPLAEPSAFNAAMEAIAEFRGVHHGWARQYIAERVDDPRGTGGTPFMSWLQQLIDETLAHRL